MSKPSWFPSSPEHVWNHFYQFTQIPRPSKKEGQIVEHLIRIARDHELEYKVDKEKNVVIYVPATKGLEGREPVIIQGHVDMVTDATPDREIDFEKDPITTKIDGDWLTADRTTLGADNGIGCAIALACITDPSVEHPALELLFTTDEETGLNGAWAVESRFFTGKRLINLDTEEWGSLYVGCAGGIDYELTKEFQLKNPSLTDFYKITLGGLTGGHSGLDIHLQLGNANKILAEFLNRYARNHKLELAQFQGGRAHNIIPRDAWAIVALDNLEDFVSQLDEYTEGLFSYLPSRDHELSFEIEKVEGEKQQVLSEKQTIAFLDLATLFPHGTHSFEDPLSKGLAATSNNFAKLLFKNGQLYTQASLRFFDREEIKKTESHLISLANLSGATLEKKSEYPSWKPLWNTPMLENVKEVYREHFHREPEVKAIHAGLECGILKDRISHELDAISFGPDITGAHSPDERVKVSSVGLCWKLLKELLKVL